MGAAPPQWSPDGRWWWDGTRWVAAIQAAQPAHPQVARQPAMRSGWGRGKGLAIVGVVVTGTIIVSAALASALGGGAASTNSHKTLLDISGTGTNTTDKFAVPNSDWDLAWSYDCNGTFTQQGNFIVLVYRADGVLTGDQVNQLGSNGSSTEHFHDGSGAFYLQITSECSWTVTVTG